MAQSKQKKSQLVTSDRGGMARLVFGAILLALGVGWAFALLMNTVSAWNTLRLLRDTAHGLAGVLCLLLPVFAAAGGALLCVSARRKISWRAYFASLGIYLCLLAVMTLVTSVARRDITLMDYIANNNKAVLGLVNNTSFGAYLTGAYNLRAFNNGQLAGGGLLGMLIAYPVYQIFNVVGGTALLIVIMLVLLLVALRINPAEIMTKMSDERYKKQQAQNENAETGEEAPPAPAPTYQPQPAEPLIRPQTVNYTTTTSVHSDPEPSYLVREDGPVRAHETTPEERGFVPVESGVLYTEHIPVNDDYKPEPTPARRKRRSERAQETPPAQTVQTVMYEPVREVEAPREIKLHTPAPELQEEMPWYEGEIPPVTEDTPAIRIVEEKPASAPEEKAEPEKPRAASRISFGKHVSDEPRQVFTDPAVPLTGERIPISPTLSRKTKEDPMAIKRTREALSAYDGEYIFPTLDLLRAPKAQKEDFSREDAARAEVLEKTLESFRIDAKVEYVVHGPAITRFALKLAEGVNVKKLNTVADTVALNMKVPDLRIAGAIPGTSLMGIEVPNAKVSVVPFREVLDSPVMRDNPSPTAVAIGKDVSGAVIVCELSDMPHMLIAGATGSGKSVCINSIIQSILYRATPDQVRMIMIDPKLVELQPYNGIPHLLTEVVSDPKKAAAALDWAVEEMGDRYRRFQKVGARNIENYNKKMKNKDDRMPQIVLIIDEFSDLMVQCRKQVEESIQRLAALARAAGIYMIVATQRPSVDVITGVIKANIPSRIAFAVTNNTDSRTILDTGGAEKLLGKGDMLYYPRGQFNPVRVQGCYVSDDEVTAITEAIKENNDAQYDSRIDEHMENAIIAEEMANSNNGKEKEKDYEFQTDTENEMLQKAIAMAVESGQTSISLLRRKFDIGHSRAGKLIDTMEEMGIISADEGPKPRRTLITREQYIKMQGQIMDQ